MPGLVLANPSGGVVVGGDVGFVTPDANTLLINQSTQSAAINWQSFSIQSSEYVIFNQPSASAVVLNRVVGGNPSEILGNLQANGRVFLINPLGVMFGEGAQVDVGGIVASTLDLNPDEFMAGRYVLRGDSQAGVANAGSITASDGGFVVLLGDHVSNTGAIHANLGSVVLASGSQVTLDFTGDGLIQHSIDTAAISDRAGVEHLGSIMADGGHVVMDANVTRDLKASVINTQGLVQARRIVKDGAGGIYLTGRGGDIALGGTLDSSGVANDAQGGRVLVTTDGDITMPSGSAVRAKGGSAASGGEVRVVAQGKYEFANGALIDAAGGTRGGFVELSGHEHLTIRGDVNLGRGGTLLIDPRDVTIADGYGPNFTDGTDVTLSEQFVEGQLQSGADVIIVADRSITLQTLADSVLDGSYFDGMDYSGGALTLGIGTVNGGAMPIMIPDDGYDAAYTGGLANFVRGAGYDGYGILFDAFEDGIRTYGGINIVGGTDYGDVDIGTLETFGDTADIYVVAHGEIRDIKAITRGADSDINITSEYGNVGLNISGTSVLTEGVDSVITLMAYGDVSGNEGGVTVRSDLGDLSVTAVTGTINNGLSFYAGGTVNLTGSNVNFVNVDAYSLSIHITGDEQGFNASFSDSFLGEFSLQTDDGHINLFTSSSISADEISLIAGGAYHDITLSPGTTLSGRVLSATAYDDITFDQTDLDFTATSSAVAQYGDIAITVVNSDSDLSTVALRAYGDITQTMGGPGTVRLGSLDAEYGYVSLENDAGGAVFTGAISAAGQVDIYSEAGINTGMITAGGYVSLEAYALSITVNGSLSAGRYVDITASGNVDLGYVSGFGYVDVRASGATSDVTVDGITLGSGAGGDDEYGATIVAGRDVNIGYATVGSATARYQADGTLDELYFIAQNGDITIGSGGLRVHDYSDGVHFADLRLNVGRSILNSSNANAGSWEVSYGAGQYGEMNLQFAQQVAGSISAGDITADSVVFQTVYGGSLSFYGSGGGDINISTLLNLPSSITSFYADDLTIRSTSGITDSVGSSFILTGTLASEGVVDLRTTDGDISVYGITTTGDALTLQAYDALGGDPYADITIGTGGIDSEGGNISVHAADYVVLNGFVKAQSGNVSIESSSSFPNLDADADGDGGIYGTGSISGVNVSLKASNGIDIDVSNSSYVDFDNEFGNSVTLDLSNVSYVTGSSLAPTATTITATNGDLAVGAAGITGGAGGVSISTNNGNLTTYGVVGVGGSSFGSVTLNANDGAVGTRTLTLNGNVTAGSSAIATLRSDDNIVINGNVTGGSVLVTADNDDADGTADAIGSISGAGYILSTNVDLFASSGIAAKLSTANTDAAFTNKNSGGVDITQYGSGLAVSYGNNMAAAGGIVISSVAASGSLSVTGALTSNNGNVTVTVAGDDTNTNNLTVGPGGISTGTGALTLRSIDDVNIGWAISTTGSTEISADYAGMDAAGVITHSAGAVSISNTALNGLYNYYGGTLTVSTGTANFNKGLNWVAASDISGGGTVALYETSTVTGAARALNNVVLDNYGTLNLALTGASSLNLTGTAVLNNTATGVVAFTATADGDDNLGGNGGTFNNQGGIIRNSSVSGRGIVNTNRLTGTGGTFDSSVGGIVQLSPVATSGNIFTGNYTVNGSNVVVGGGTLRFNGPNVITGSLRQNSGTVIFTDLTLSGAFDRFAGTTHFGTASIGGLLTLNGAAVITHLTGGTLTANGGVNWNNDNAIQGPGSLLIPFGTTFNITGAGNRTLSLGAVLNNAGTINIGITTANAVSLASNSTLNNLSTGVINFTATNSGADILGNGSGNIHNLGGTIRNSSVSGVATVSALTFTSTGGTFEAVGSSTLNLQTLTAAGNNFSGNYTLIGNNVFFGSTGGGTGSSGAAGTFNFNDAATVISGNFKQNSTTWGLVKFVSGASITGSYNRISGDTNFGAASIGGLLTLNGTGLTTLTGGTLTANGGVTWNNTGVISGSGTLEIPSTQIFNLNGTGDRTLNGATLLNNGTLNFNLTGGARTLFLNNGAVLTNNGLVDFTVTGGGDDNIATSAGSGNTLDNNAGGIVRNTGGGDVTVTASQISSAAGSLFEAALGGITLNANGGSLNLAGDIVAGAFVDLDSAGAVSLGPINSGGSLDVTANGIIDNTSGSLSIAGTTTVSAGSGNNIGLDFGTNNFVGAVNVISGQNFSVRDTDNLILGNITISQGMTARATGALTDSGNLSIGLNADLYGSSITLGDAMGEITNFGAIGGDSYGVRLYSSGAVNLTEDGTLRVLLQGMTPSSLTLTSQTGDIAVPVLSSNGSLTLDAELGHVSLNGDLRTYGGGVTLRAYGDVTGATFDILALSADGLTYGDIAVDAGLAPSATGGGVTLDDLTGHSIVITANAGVSSLGDITVGDVYAAGDLTLNADGTLTTGAQTTPGDLVITANALSFSGDVSANQIDISITGDNSNFSFTNLAATGGYVLVDTADGFISGGDITAAQSVTLMTGDNDADGDSGITVGAVTANGAYGIALSGYGNISAARLIALGDGVSIDANGYDVDVTDGGAGQISAATLSLINVTDFTADDITLTSGLTASVLNNLAINGTLQSGGSIDLSAGGYLALANVVGGSPVQGDVVLNGDDGVTISEALEAEGYVDISSTGGDISTQGITAGGYIDLTADTGNVMTGDLSGYDRVFVTAGSEISVGDIQIYTALSPTAETYGAQIEAVNGDVTVGAITVGAADREFVSNDDTSISVQSSYGNINLNGNVRLYGGISGGTNPDVGLGAYGDITGTGYSVQAFYGSSYGDLQILAGHGFGMSSDIGGDVTLANLTGYDVTVVAYAGAMSNGDITVGEIYAAGDLTLNADGTLTTGAQTTPGDLVITANALSFSDDVSANQIDISITGDNSNFSFTNLAATGGYVLVDTADGFISGGDITAAQSVTLMTGDNDADGDSGITVGAVTANGAYGIALSGYGNISAARLIALGDGVSIDANGYDVDVTDGGAGQISAATLSLINVNRFIVDSLALSHTGLNTFSIGGDFILNDSLTSAGDVSITTAEDIHLNGYVDVAGYVTLSANGASGVIGATDANVYGDQGVTILASAADINLIGSVSSSAGYVDIRAFNELDIDSAVYGQADVSLFGENGFVDLAAVVSDNGTVTISGKTLTLNGAISGDAVDIHAYGAYASSAGSISFFGDITSDVGSVSLTTEDNLIQGNGSGTDILGYGGVNILMQGDEGHLSFLNNVSSSNGNVVITSEAIGISGISIDGDLQAYGNIDLTALAGNIAFGTGGADAETGYLSARSDTLGFLFSDLSAGTDVTLTVTGGGNGIRLNHNISAGGVITATATNSDITGFDDAYVISGAGGITLDAEGGQVNVSQTLTSSNGGISLRSSDSIQVSDLNSYAGIYLDAESGSIVSLGLLNAADGVTLVATQNISISDVTAGGLLSIDAEAGDLTFTTGAYLQANLLNADAVNIFGDGFDVASVTDFYLTATGGDITLTDGDIVAGNLADLRAYDSLTLINTNITAGSLALDAGGDVSLDPLELRSDNDISINAGGYVMGDQVGLYAGTTLEIDAGSFVQFDASGLYSSGLSVDASSTIDLAGTYVSVLGYGSVADDFAVNESALTDPDLPFVPVSANPNARFRAGSVSLGELNLTGDYLFIATDNLSLTPATMLGVPVDILVQLTTFTPSASIRIVDNPAGLTLVAGDVYFSRVNHFDKFPGTTYVFGSDGYNGQIIIGENGPVAGNNADFLFFTSGGVSGAGLITTTGSVATLDLVSSTALGDAAEIINEINNNIVGDTTQLAANSESAEDTGPVDESGAQIAEDGGGDDDEDEDDEAASADGEEPAEDDKFEGQTDSETNSVVDQECTS